MMPATFSPRINSSHNLAVTTYLFKELRTTFTDVDPECAKGNLKDVVIILMSSVLLSFIGITFIYDLFNRLQDVF